MFIRVAMTASGTFKIYTSESDDYFVITPKKVYHFTFTGLSSGISIPRGRTVYDITGNSIVFVNWDIKAIDPEEKSLANDPQYIRFLDQIRRIAPGRYAKTSRKIKESQSNTPTDESISEVEETKTEDPIFYL